jgi:allantoinase
MTALIVLTSLNVLLPGRDDLIPATIEMDLVTGKIVEIYLEKRGKDCYEDLQDGMYIDAGDLYILPGLVESVRIIHNTLRVKYT